MQLLLETINYISHWEYQTKTKTKTKTVTKTLKLYRQLVTKYQHDF